MRQYLRKYEFFDLAEISIGTGLHSQHKVSMGWLHRKRESGKEFPSRGSRLREPARQVDQNTPESRVTPSVGPLLWRCNSYDIIDLDLQKDRTPSRRCLAYTESALAEGWSGLGRGRGFSVTKLFRPGSSMIIRSSKLAGSLSHQNSGSVTV